MTAWTQPDFGFIDSIQYIQPEKALSLLDEIENQNTTPAQQVEVLRYRANIQWHLGDMAQSIKQYRASAALARRLGDNETYASILSDIGYVFSDMSQYDSSIFYLQKSVQLAEELDNEALIIHNKNFLAHCYDRMQKHQTAIDINEEVLQYYQDNGEELRVAKIQNNLGSLYWTKGSLDTAINYFRISSAIFLREQNPELYSMSFYNLANCYDELGKHDSAIYYIEKAIPLFEQAQNGMYTPASYISYGDIMYRMERYQEAVEWLQKAQTYINQKGKDNNTLRRLIYKNLSTVYADAGQYEQGYHYLDLYHKINDSLEIAEQNKLVSQLEARYESEKKNREIVVLHKEKEKQRIVIVAIALGLLLVLFFLWFVYNRLKLIRSQKQVIEQTMTQLSQTNEELAAQRDEIERQKVHIEDAHKEIKDSIEYAKRIQQAILPTQTLRYELLPDSFVLYRPKDVVAGDFYWLEPSADAVLVAVADCTGHGVPGAMVSVVCHNALNRAVREFGLIDPGVILDKTRALVLEELSKSGQSIQDGMDIALCKIKGRDMEYAGAYNPLWVVRGDELIEVKADRQPVGKVEELKPFTTHSMKLEVGDMVYLFSDGYADQFGGPRDKKYGIRQWKQLLVTLANSAVIEQHKQLEDEIMAWMDEGNSEQIDDICVWGIRIG